MLKQFLINIGRLEGDKTSHKTGTSPSVEACKVEKIIREQSQNWSDQINEMENYFQNTSIPTNPIKLDGCSTITDAKLFIESHIATVRANNGNKTFLPYLNRLNKLKIILNT